MIIRGVIGHFGLYLDYTENCHFFEYNIMGLGGSLGGPYFYLMDSEGWGKSFTRKNVSFVHLSHSLILKASSCRASSVKKNGQKIEKKFFTVKIDMKKFSAIFVRI